MKKLLFIAVLLLAGCSSRTLMVGTQEEPLYIDKGNNLLAVKRDGAYYYVLWAENTQRYIFDAVPYNNTAYMEKLPHSKCIYPLTYGTQGKAVRQ
jgi:hypothetical protein